MYMGPESRICDLEGLITRQCDFKYLIMGLDHTCNFHMVKIGSRTASKNDR